MGGSINGESPKWMVYNGSLMTQIHDLEVPQFQETSIPNGPIPPVQGGTHL